jgi:hypothetical protein
MADSTDRSTLAPEADDRTVRSRGRAMKKFPNSGNTFDPIELDAAKLAAEPDFSRYVDALTGKVELLTDERAGYYNGLRAKGSWVNGCRRALIWLGGLALLLTALATVMRIAPPISDKPPPFPNFDAFLLILVLTLYAVMAAISFVERSSAAANGYFRHISVIVAIRNLWTQFQFEQLKLLQGTTVGDPASVARARAGLAELAQNYCTQLDSIAAGEGETWRDEFKASLTELGTLSQSRLTEVETQLKAQRDEIKHMTDKQAEAKAAEKPVFVNLTIAGDFEGEATIFVDGSEKTRTKLKALALGAIVPGQRVFRVVAQKAGGRLEAEKAEQVEPGKPTDVTITLA